jgi:hypothetical protein
MKHLILITIFIVNSTTIFAQNSDDNKTLENPTHVLELIQGIANDTIKVDVKISNENNTDYLFILTPDENLLKVEFHIINDEIKFQLTGFNNDKLAAIQYVGKGDKQNIIEGKYVALVDGIQREDMSGKFKLTKK